MNKSLNISIYIYILLISYLGQGVFYEVGSNYAKWGLALYSLIAILFIFYGLINRYTKSRTYLFLFYFLLLNTVYFIFNPEGINDIFFTHYRTILFTIGTFFIFFHLSVRNYLNDKIFIFYFIFLLIIAILNYFVYANYQNLTEDVQNNAIYFIVMLLPIIFLIRIRFISLIIFPILIIFIISSLKRGAIITSFLIFILFIIYNFKIINKNKLSAKTLLLKIFISIIILSISIFLINYFLNNQIVIERFNGIKEDGGSSRDYIFTAILDSMLNIDNIFSLIIGLF